jgi:hypothetical protein
LHTWNCAKSTIFVKFAVIITPKIGFVVASIADHNTATAP